MTEIKRSTNWATLHGFGITSFENRNSINWFTLKRQSLKDNHLFKIPTFRIRKLNSILKIKWKNSPLFDQKVISSPQFSVGYVIPTKKLQFLNILQCYYANYFKVSHPVTSCHRWPSNTNLTSLLHPPHRYFCVVKITKMKMW